ncbi:MAG: sulfotransferase domain-containing protein [Pseudomonadota bacterium]
MSQQTLIWIASYPKSGNTWVRALLANYMLGTDKPLPLETIRSISHGDVPRPTYERLSGRPADQLDAEALMVTRHAHLKEIAAAAPNNFVKTHYPVGQIAGRAFIPPALTKSAIYVLRNPLDLVLSYADHWNTDHSMAGAQLAHARNTVALTHKTVPQFLGNWSDHVTSWTSGRAFPVAILRYEDLLVDAGAALAGALETIGLPVEPERVAQAVRFADFRELARQEAEGGFEERGSTQARFFREGRADQWRQDLDPAIAIRIRRDHGAVMQRFGYL